MPSTTNYQPLSKFEEVKKAIDYLNESTEVGEVNDKKQTMTPDELYEYYSNKPAIDDRSIPLSEDSKYNKTFVPRDLLEGSVYDQLQAHKADSQTGWEKTGNMLARGLAKAAISVVEPLGYLLDVEQIATNVNEYEEEYGNWFNNWLIKQEEKLDAAFPIHTKDNQPTIGSSDWFLKNGDQILKSIGYFVPGMVGTKLAMRAFKLLQMAEIIPATLAATKARGIVAPLTSVVAMNYNEHMRSAVEVFKEGKEDFYNKYYTEYRDTLDKALESGDINKLQYDEYLTEASIEANTRAKKEASVFAEDIIKKGKANIPLELVEYMTLFKYMGGTRATDDVAAKMLSVANAKPLLADFLKSGGSEYLQEVNTGFFEKEASRGIKLATDQIEENPNEDAAQRYLEHISSYEGLTEGLSGMIGGSGMQMLSTVMAQKSRNVARDIQKELANIEGNPEKFNSIQKEDLIDLLQRSAIAGKSGSAISTFDSISKMSEEEAKSLNLGPDYATKAKEYKDTAIEFEKSFNDLSILHQENPVARNILLNRKMNNYFATNDLAKLEVDLKETKNKYASDQLNSPVFEFKEVEARLASLNQMIADNDVLLSELDDKYVKRNIKTNETAEEIEARTKEVYDSIDRLNETKLKLANDYLKSKYTPAEKKEGVEQKKPHFVLTTEVIDPTSSDPKELSKSKSTIATNLELVDSDKQSNEILKSLNKELSTQTAVDNEYFGKLAQAEYLKSVRDSSFKSYNEFLEDPKKLTDVIKDIQRRGVEERDKVITNIKNANLRELEELKVGLTDKDLLTSIDTRSKELKQIEEDLRKNNEAKAKANADAITEANRTKPNTVVADNTTVVPPPPAKADPAKKLTYADIKDVNDRLEGSELDKGIEEIKKVQLPIIIPPKATTPDNINKQESVLTPDMLSFGQLNKALEDYNKVIAVNTSLSDKLISEGDMNGHINLKEIIDNLHENRQELYNERLKRLRSKTTGSIADAMVNPQVLDSTDLIPQAKAKVDAELVDFNIPNVLDNKSSAELENQLGLLKLNESIIRTETTAAIATRPDVTESALQLEQVAINQNNIKINEVTSALESKTSEQFPVRNDVKDTPIFEEEGGKFISNRKMFLGVSDVTIPRMIFARTNKGRILQNLKTNGKLLDSATSAAYLDMNYMVVDDPEVGETKYTVANDNIIRNSFIKSLVDDPNTTIQYVVDKDSKYHQEVVDKYGLNTEQYFKEAPIKIQAVKDGKVIETDTWIHKASWVADNTKVTPEQPDNDKIQQERIIKIRNKVFENDKLGIPTKAVVTSVSMGKPNFNVKYETTYANGKKEVRPVISTTGRPAIESLPVAEALPGLESFAIMDAGSLRDSKNSIVPKADILTTLSKNNTNGMLFGIHLDPLSNRKVAIPLSSTTLGTKNMKPVKRGIVNAIKNFYSNTPSSDLGFTPNDGATLATYLSKFIYLKNYRPVLSSDYNIAKTNRGIVIAEPADSEAGLAYGINMDTGTPTVYRYNIASGGVNRGTVMTDPDAIQMFYDKLNRVLDNTGLSVSLDNINSTTPFEVPVIKDNGKSDVLRYSSYNDFLKSSLNTIFNGRTMLDNGKYTVLTQNNVQTELEEDANERGINEETISKDSEGVVEVKDTKTIASLEGIINDEEYGDQFPVINPNSKPVDYDKTVEYSEIYDKLLPEFKSNILQQDHFVNSIVNNLIRFSLDSIYLDDKAINISKSLDKIKELDQKEYAAVRDIYETGYEEVVKNAKYKPILDKFNITSQESAKVRLAAFEKFINNWEALAKLALARLNDMKLIDGEYNDNLNDENNFYERSQYDSKLRLQVNPSSYSNKLRIRFANIPLQEYTTDEKGNRKLITITNSLGRPVYADPETLYNTVLEILSDTVITLGQVQTNVANNVTEYIDGAIEVLNKHSLNYPTLQGVIDLLTKPTGIFEDIINDPNLNKDQKTEAKKVKQNDYLQSTRTLFTNATLNTKIRLKKIIIYNNGDRTAIKSIFINEVGGYKGVVDNWNHHQRRLGLFEVDGDTLIVNKDKIRDIKRELDTLVVEELNKELKDKTATTFVSPEFLTKFSAILAKLGLMQSDRSNIDPQSILDLAKKSIKANNVGILDIRDWLKTNLQTEAVDPKSTNTVFSKLFTHLLSDHTKLDYSTDNVFNFGELFPSFVKPLAEAVYDNNEMSYSLVSIDSEGNIIYEIQKYNSLMSAVRELKDPNGKLLDNLLAVPFTSGNPLIQKLKSDKVVLNNFDISFYDSTVETINKNGKNKKSVDSRENMSYFLQAKAGINVFQASPLNIASTTNFADYLGLTLGDNPISFIMTSLRKVYAYRISVDPTTKNYVFDTPAAMVDDVTSRVMGEFKRIIDFNKLKSEGISFNNSKYDKNGNKFVMFNYLNFESIGKYLKSEPGISVEDKIDMIYKKVTRTSVDVANNVTAYELINSSKSISYIKEAIKNYLTESVSAFEKSLIDSGIITMGQSDIGSVYESSVMDETYLESINSYHMAVSKTVNFENESKATRDHHAIKSAVLDFFVNQYIANSDMYSLFNNDLAHYASNNSDGTLDLVKTNATIQKRLRQLVTPFIRGNYQKSHSNVININDIILKSELEDLQNAGYIDFNIDDGLEVATMKEALHDQLAYDQISQSQFDKLIKKVNDPNYRFTDKDLQLLDVKKPISWDNNPNLDHGTIYPHRIKSSRFYLDPAITKDFPALDALRVFMETRDIDRAVFESGVKVSSTKILEIFKDGEINQEAITAYDNDVDSYRFMQTYNNTGLVTLLPNSKTKISNVIQVDRGLFTGIRQMTDFKLREFVNGKYVNSVKTGAELERIKENIRIAQLELGKAQLIEDFGITFENGKLRFNNFDKLHKILEEEGASRNWIKNSIDLLKLTNDKRFELSLPMNNNLSRIESVLFSIINKKLVKHKITGGSWVQIPNIGHTTKDTAVVSLEDATKDIKSSIIYVDGYKKGSKLKFISKSKGEVKRAQIIVSWNFRDNNNKLLNIEDYVIEKNGKLVIDYDKLPKELLEGIAMRIPNQKHSNMLPFEIVGFLPPYHKDTVIVPNEIVVQMGSDFDIDKLYSYLYDYYKDLDSNKLIVIRRDDERALNSKARLAEITKELAEITKSREEVKNTIKEYKKNVDFKHEVLIEIERLTKQLNDIDENSDDYSDIEMQIDLLEGTLDSKSFREKVDPNIGTSALRFLGNRSKLLSLRAEKKLLSTKLKESAFLNNEYIDIHNSVLMHPDVYKKITAKLDFNDLGDMVNKLGKNEITDILNPTYQMKSYISQYAGKRLLSTVSLHVAMLGLVERINNGSFEGKSVSIMEAGDFGVMHNSSIDIFKGVKLQYLNGEGTYKYKGQNRTTLDTVVIIQNASVDNASDPQLGYVNLNNLTIGASLLTAYLKDNNGNAVGIEHIVEFMNQPIIKEMVELSLHYKDISDGGMSDYDAKSKAISQLYDKYSYKYDIDLATKTVKRDAEGNPIRVLVQSDKAKSSFTIEELENMRTNPKRNDEYKLNQLAILRAFERLDSYFITLDNSRRALLNPSKSGLGKNYATVLYQKMLIDRYLKPQTKENKRNISNLELLYKNPDKTFTQSGYFVNQAIEVFGEGVADIFDYNYENLNAFINAVLSSKSIIDIDANTYSKALTHYRKATYSSSSSLYTEDVNELRTRLIVGEDTLAKRIDKLKDMIVNGDPEFSDLYNNKFLQAITPQIDVNKHKIDLISHKFMSKVGIDPEATNVAISQLLSHPSKFVRDIAIDLIKYTFAFGQPTAANYQQDISFNYLKAIGFFDNLRNLDISHKYMFKNYIQHNPYEAIAINPNDIAAMGGNLISDKFKKNDLPVVVVTEFTIPVYKPNVSNMFRYMYSDGMFHLYERVSVTTEGGNKIGRYVKIPTLGSTNYSKIQFMEGDYTNPNRLSSFNLNNVGIEQPVSGRESNSPIPVPNSNTTFSNTYLDGNKVLNANKVLDNIDLNPAMNMLAGYLSKIITANNILLPVSENNIMAAYGLFTHGTSSKSSKIEINAYRIKQEHPDMHGQLIEEVLVHEAIHGITSEKLKLFDDGQLDKLTTSEKAAIRRFNELREYVVGIVKQSPQYNQIEQEINDYYNRVNKKSDESVQGLTNKHMLQYALRSNSEFLTGILTNETVQEALNNIRYTDKKTLLQELKDLIKKLVEHFINSLYINVNDNNTLKEAITQAFDIIDKLNTPTETRSDNIQDITPIQNDQLDLFNQNGNEAFDLYPNSSNLITSPFEKMTKDQQVAFEKTIRDVAARMSDRIGIDFKITNSKNDKFKGRLIKNLGRWGNPYGNSEYTAEINLAYATLDTPIHEILAHPIIKAISLSNLKTKLAKSQEEYDSLINDGYEEVGLDKEGFPIFEEKFSALYKNLLKELEYGKGKEVLDRIKRDYQYKTENNEAPNINDSVYLSEENQYEPVYFSEEDFNNDLKLKSYTLQEQQYEAIVELLGLYTSNKISSFENGNLILLLKKLYNEIKTFVKELLMSKEVNIDSLPDNMTIGDIANLLAYSSNKLILPGHEVIYTTPDNMKFKTYQEASNHISQLSKNIKNIDLTDINLENNFTDAQKQEINKIEDELTDLQYQANNFKYELVPFSKFIDIDTTSGRLRNNYWALKEDGTTGYIGNSKETLLEPEYHGFVLYTGSVDNRGYIKITDEQALELYTNTSTLEKATLDSRQKKLDLENNIHNLKRRLDILKSNSIDSFISRNKQYEQAKEIIDEWKKINNIQYNPEEVYSRGQEFVSVIGAYSSFDVTLMMQNLLDHIQDNEKAGGKFAISAFTKPIDQRVSHLEDMGKIKFKIYPKSQDILWASNTDVFSGSIWDASEKVNKDKKSELLGVSYTKYPALQNIHNIQPNLASIIDNLNHQHNELGIVLTSNNFRLEYNNDASYQTKKLIDNINSILDQRYGKLVKPDIKNSYDISKRVTNVQDIPINEFKYYDYFGDIFYYKKENDAWYVSFTKETYDSGDKQLANLNHIITDYNTFISSQKIQGIKPTQTNENLKVTINSVRAKILNDFNIIDDKSRIGEKVKFRDKIYEVIDIESIEEENGDINNKYTIAFGNPEDIDFDYRSVWAGEIEWLQEKKHTSKEYTSQALVNTKVAKLKEVAKKYPRSLIRSEVKKVSETNSTPNYELDDLDFQKIPSVNNNEITDFSSELFDIC